MLWCHRVVMTDRQSLSFAAYECASLCCHFLQGYIDTLDGSRNWFFHSGWHTIVQALDAAPGDELLLRRADDIGPRCVASSHSDYEWVQQAVELWWHSSTVLQKHAITANECAD